MKRTAYIHTAALLAGMALTMTVAMAGCSEDRMDEINRRDDHPTDVPAKFLLADVLTSTAFNTAGSDFSFYASVYVEHETGIHSGMYGAETRDNTPSDAYTYTNKWSGTYTNIKNAKIAIAKCLDEGSADSGNEITLGVAKMMLAYNAAVLTDLFGDVPFTEAGEVKPDGTPLYRQPAIDRQEDIYTSVLALLNEAIAHFNGTDAGESGAIENTDVIYEGNRSLWRKAAYGLMARYTMRLLGRSSQPAVDLKNIIAYVDHSFANAGQEMKFNHYDGSLHVNPLFGFNYSREALGASKSLHERLVRLNDPRASRYFSDGRRIVTTPGEVRTAPNGNPIESLQAEVYDMSTVSMALTAPTQLLSYHELLFLKAEAMSRLNAPEAKETLREAVTAAFANLNESIRSSINYDFTFYEDYEIDAEVVDDYINTSVFVRFEATPLQEVMLQKYLAFAGASGEAIEAYNDYRRLKSTGESVVALANPHNTPRFPLRFAYGRDDVLANAAVKNAYGDGSYVYREPVWWAGGER